MKTTTFLSFLMTMPFIAVAQLQNTDFEQWENPIDDSGFTNRNRPVGWAITNDQDLDPEGGSTFAYYPPDTDAQNGNYALKMSVWYNYVKDVAVQTAPVDYRPQALSGYYKYTDNIITGDKGDVTDRASVTIYLTKYNDTASRRDTIGTGHIFLDAAETYTAFRCPVAYTTEDVPDSVTAILDCSLLRREVFPAIAQNGFASLFTVDNIILEAETMATGNIVKNTTTLYPNPVKDILNIEGFTGTASVYDVTGKRVLTMAVLNKKSMGVSVLKSGVYVLKGDGVETQPVRFVKQ